MDLLPQTRFSQNSRFDRINQATRKPVRVEPHRVLRISRGETDPVQIILAAQIQLRRWRRGEPGETPLRIRQRIRQIIAARDSLMAMNRAIALMQSAQPANRVLNAALFGAAMTPAGGMPFATDGASEATTPLRRTV